MQQAKRLYKSVSVDERPDGFVVRLDRRQAKTPAGAVLSVPTRALARAIAEEWVAQSEIVDPDSMPLYRLAVLAIDKIGADRPAVIAKLAAFAQSDLLCYRAERPDALIERQVAAWNPILDWIAETYGARFRITGGIVPIEQPPEAVGKIRSAIEELDDFSLAALSSATAACGSVFLGLALIAGRIDAGEAGDYSLLDETFQAEKWGEDEEAAQRRRAIKGEIGSAGRFIELLAAGRGGADNQKRN